jgi:hypothetical protein
MAPAQTQAPPRGHGQGARPRREGVDVDVDVIATDTGARFVDYTQYKTDAVRRYCLQMRAPRNRRSPRLPSATLPFPPRTAGVRICRPFTEPAVVVSFVSSNIPGAFCGTGLKLFAQENAQA